MLIRNEPVKVLKINADERVRCMYCTRKAKKDAILFRKFDELGVLEEMLIFCCHGCAMAHATKPQRRNARRERV